MEKQGGKARMGAGWVGGERGESNRCEGIAVGRVLQLGEQARKKLAGERGRRAQRYNWVWGPRSGEAPPNPARTSHRR